MRKIALVLMFILLFASCNPSTYVSENKDVKIKITRVVTEDNKQLVYIIEYKGLEFISFNNGLIQVKSEK